MFNGQERTKGGHLYLKESLHDENMRFEKSKGHVTTIMAVSWSFGADIDDSLPIKSKLLALRQFIVIGIITSTDASVTSKAKATFLLQNIAFPFGKLHITKIGSSHHCNFLCL